MSYFPMFSIPDEINEAIVIIKSCIEVMPEERENYKESFDKLARYCEKYLEAYND